MNEATSLIEILIGETKCGSVRWFMIINGNNTPKCCSLITSYSLINAFELRMIGNCLAILLCLLETLFCQTVTTGSPVSGSTGISFVGWEHSKDFDHSKPLTGKKPYAGDPEIMVKDISCNEKGYKKYLKQWKAQKSYWNKYSSKEYKMRLGYFKEACKTIQYANAVKSMKLEFTFYADWDRSEFESITQSLVRYNHYPLATYDIDVGNKNANYRYLMPSMDPCEMDPSLRSVVSEPTNRTVSWAFAITNSIEYAIKKRYLEEYDQIVEVSLSAQELIDCANPDPEDPYSIDMGGLSLQTGFNYVMEKGIAYSGYYPYTHSQGKCKTVAPEHKFHIVSYDTVEVPNKKGLFQLMADGPVAVLMGLDPKYLQYYRSDSNMGPYLSTSAGYPSVYGVVVEYHQYAVDGAPKLASNPYFAVETRLRGCDSFVFRLPILDTIDNSNVGGIAGFAYRPVVDVLPTTAPTALPTTAPTADVPTPAVLPTTSAPTLTPTPTPTPEPWLPIYDPFILGDNCNYEVQETCLDHILPNMVVLNRYLAVRDTFPKEALKHTRVIALSGMTAPAIHLWRESLSRQEKNPAPVDMYFYSDSKLDNYVDATMAEPLISLAEYTRPSRIVFGDGSFKREGMASVIQWMVDNRDKGYFKNLEYFQISGHKAAAYEGTAEDALALQNQIVANLHTMCTDKESFPKLRTMNFDSNSYNEFNNGFDAALRGACNESETFVTILATDNAVAYPTMCSTTSRDNYWYYDMSDTNEIFQCRFTWNWEMNDPDIVYSSNGPFPNANTPSC